MPTFADSFWSGDYAGGLGVLFGKLQQGVVENQQILTIASMRAEAEEQYSDRLGDIAPAVDRMGGGFARDDGASVRKAYEGVRSEMVEAAKNHQKIASNIRELVVNPFSRWCDAHASRVQNSQDDLQARIKAHDRQADQVKKLRGQYFNKCRLVEDFEEENKFAFQEPEKEVQSPKIQPTPTIVLPEESDEEPEPVELGDQYYNPEQLKQLLTSMLETIKLGEAKVPILGVYQNVSTGSDIVDFITKNLNASSISYAERIGQDLVDKGFLRLVGNVGSTFANSSRMNYQWRPKCFELSGVPDKRKPLTRTGTGNGILRTGTISSDIFENPNVGAMQEMLAGWNPLNNAHPNETPIEKLKREARESDDRYKAAVRKLDLMRCQLEEVMMQHLKFMEQCELDRLKAIKSVALDFSGAISNVIPSLQSNVDNMMLYQETIQPLGDLRYLLENYRTGAFVPRVQIYENYYNNVEDQTFGVDLEARARADRKRVPIIVTTILTFLDNHYPDLEGDQARRGIWLADVPLAATHHLRNQINDGKTIPKDLLEKYEIPIVASVLKLYLLELPDSLVSSQVYEIVKTIYSTTANETSEEGRVKVLQSTLGQLRLNNIATLDAICTHFTRLIDLTSADEPYVAALAQNLAPCILRPRTETSLTMNERHSYRLIRDLFQHKEAIFGELKRQSSTLGLGSSAGPNARPRAISTDESTRRQHMQERVRAITERSGRSRASSPNPANRHRRDKSTDGPAMTRFPINVASPTSAIHVRKARESLEVPLSSENSPVSDTTPTKPQNTTVDIAAAANAAAAARTTSPDTVSSPTVSEPSSVTTAATDVEKRNSLNRVSGGRFSRKPGLGRQSLTGKRESVASVAGSGGVLHEEGETNGNGVSEEDRPVGVTLEDKPMDDD